MMLKKEKTSCAPPCQVLQSMWKNWELQEAGSKKYTVPFIFLIPFKIISFFLQKSVEDF